jgi:hypothetical protein
MAEIQTLREVFRKEGLQFVHKLFDNFVIISEKLNATRFCFEKDENGDLCFYKKDGKITSIDRTLSKLYDQPIQYIESLPKEVINQLPSGYRFGFRYFHSATPIRIAYDKAPMNGLVLTDIQNTKGKVIDDITILNPISDLLRVDKPPIIWYGKLDEVQKTRLLEYLRTPEDQLQKRFKTDSFTKYIISILNPEMKKTALNSSTEKPIDSIMFKFLSDDRKEVIYAKAVDPIIQQLNRTNEEEREPQDMYAIILSDIVEFVNLNGLKKYPLKETDPEKRYTELVCLIFNDYIKKYGYRYEGVELDPLSFTNIPEFSLNTGLIPDLKTRELLKDSLINKNIFKIMMTAFQKPRKKAVGLLTQLLIDDLKDISIKVKGKTENVESTKESVMPTFEEYFSSKVEKSWNIKD